MLEKIGSDLNMHVGKDREKAPSISPEGGGNLEDYIVELFFMYSQLQVPSPSERDWGEAGFKNSPLLLPSGSNHTLRNCASAGI